MKEGDLSDCRKHECALAFLPFWCVFSKFLKAMHMVPDVLDTLHQDVALGDCEFVTRMRPRPRLKRHPCCSMARLIVVWSSFVSSMHDDPQIMCCMCRDLVRASWVSCEDDFNRWHTMRVLDICVRHNCVRSRIFT